MVRGPSDPSINHKIQPVLSVTLKYICGVKSKHGNCIWNMSLTSCNVDDDDDVVVDDVTNVGFVYHYCWIGSTTAYYHYPRGISNMVDVRC